MKVRQLVELLFSQYPASQAEPWDRPGLSVGNPSAEVARVACALDPTPDTVAQAHAAGCNVLVTHHPVFKEAPFPITAGIADGTIGGATAFAAARLGVSLVAMHTNLDRSDDALDLHASLLGVSRTGRLCEPDGFGALLDVEGLTVGDVARRCAEAYGTTPIVWGPDAARPRRAAFCSGSLGDLGSVAMRQGVGLVITGEGGYHRLSELVDAGVGAILLGHDASELPYAGLLARTIGREAPDTSIVVVNEGLRWHAWVAEE